jgi:cytochrome P450
MSASGATGMAREGEGGFIDVSGELSPASPPPASVGTLGLIRAFRSDMLGAFSADFYTDLRVSFRRLGHRFICLNDPEDIDHVLNTHMDRYQTNVLGQRLLEPIVGRGLIFAEGDEWRRQHAQLAPFFQPRNMERLISTFHETAMDAIASWPRDCEFERDLLADFRRLTLAVIARSLLSIDDEKRTAQLADFASRAESSGSLLEWRDYFALFFWPGIGQPPARLEFAAHWRLWVKGLVASRPPIDNGGQAHDMLDLLRARPAGQDGGAQSAEIVDQVGSMLSAGFITTAIALFWAAVVLARFPAHQEAMRRELCQGDAMEPPDWTTLRSTRTAMLFVYETLRLYPPVYVIAREARQNDSIGNFAIPRGAAVIISSWTVHRHASHWRDPNRFDPGRFLKGDRIVLPKAWMPFGVGPRVCIGNTFATMEILVVLRCLLARYHIGLRSPTPRPIGRVTLTPDFAPSFILTPI